MNAVQILIIVGTLLFIVLGTVHNIYTAIDKKGHSGFPRPILPSAPPWKAAVFAFTRPRMSGARGSVLIATLALTDIESLVQSRTLMAIGTIVPLIYLRLAFQYCLIIPLVGIGVGATAMLGAFELAI